MKISAVICEYNPFHAGHAYHIAMAKKNADAVIAIMSGSFTQRGLPAVISRSERAQCALAGGADLVLELPFPFCCGSAELFARGGVSLANRLSVVNTLSFGSESGNIRELKATAAQMNSDAFRDAVGSAAQNTHTASYGRLYFDEYRRLFGKNPCMTGSNDLLALSYIRELERTHSLIQPEPVLRTGSAYNDTASENSTSATAIRLQLEKGIIPDNLPPYSADVLKNAMQSGSLSDYKNLFLPYVSYFRTHSAKEYCSFAEVGKELSERFENAAWNATDWQSFFDLSAAKTFSASRLYRAALFAFLGVSSDCFDEIKYTRVLAADDIGRTILGMLSQNCDLPIITKAADYHGYGIDEIYELGLRADALWLLTLKKPASADLLIKEHPFIK